MTPDGTPFQQFLDALETHLRTMPFSNQLAFAASCCERTFPLYAAFSDLHRWGDTSILRSAIDEAWTIACGASLDAVKISEFARKCEKVTPKSDDFVGVEVTFAQEAAFMATLLLQFCLVRDPRYVVRIATFGRDTVDLYVQTEESLDPSDRDLEEKIAAHFLMIRELEQQKTDLGVLRRIQLPNDICDFRTQIRKKILETGDRRDVF